MRSALKLRHRLLAMILLVMLPTAAVIVYDVVEARTRHIESAKVQGRDLAQAVIHAQEHAISHVEGLLNLLVRVPQVRDLAVPACSEIMAEIVRAQPRYALIIATDKAGKTLCSSNLAGLGISIADRPIFTRVLATEDFSIGDYTIGRISARPILGFALPIRAQGDVINGFAIASIDLGWFGANEVAQDLPENATFTLVDQSGTVMARSPDAGGWVGKSAAGTPLFAALQGLEQPADIATRDLDGTETFFHLVELRGTAKANSIFVAVGLNLEANMAAINRDLLIKIALLLATGGAIATFAYLMSARMISRPVQQMVALSSRIAGGDLSVRSGIDHGAGEFATLALSLDSMAQSLEGNQRQLLEQQQYMRAVLDNAAEIILAFDPDGMLVFANAAARNAGLPSAKVSYQDLVPAESIILDSNHQMMPREDWPLYRIMRGETLYNFEMNWKPRAGDEPRAILVNGQPIKAEGGQHLGFAVVVHDVTDLRATEASLRQSQKLEAVGQLTGGIAHDFNNLLSVVIGNLDTLLPHLSHPRDVELANEALNGALRGAALTRQMLAFARRQALEPKVIDLAQHLPHLGALLERTLGEAITVTHHSTPDLWPCPVDASQLDSVLLNFAINARDAMPHGGALTIEVGNVQLDAQYAASNVEVTPGDYVRIAVTDTGEGIPEAILGHVMEPFFTTKAPGQGTGLGLSMAFGFAKQSGGHLKIYSEVGHGTTINLYLPRAAMDVRDVARPVSVLPVLPHGHESILLVDDNEAVRKTAARQLTDLGYQVIESENAAGALEIMGSGRPIDLLFSDVVMPGGLDGFDLAAEAQARYPKLKILLVTGFAEAAIRDRAALKGGTDSAKIELLSKPYRRPELAQRVRALLDRV